MSNYLSVYLSALSKVKVKVQVTSICIARFREHLQRVQIWK